MESPHSMRGPSPEASGACYEVNKLRSISSLGEEFWGRWCYKHHHWLNDAPPCKTASDELLESVKVPRHAAARLATEGTEQRAPLESLPNSGAAMSVPTGTKQKLEPVYLGDAVYASFDGWHIWLHLNAHYTPGLIAIEPEVYEALKRYAKEAWGKS